MGEEEKIQMIKIKQDTTNKQMRSSDINERAAFQLHPPFPTLLSHSHNIDALPPP